MFEGTELKITVIQLEWRNHIPGTLEETLLEVRLRHESYLWLLWYCTAIKHIKYISNEEHKRNKMP